MLETFSRTAFSKWLRIGQPGVVSDTITLTAPCGSISIERTMSSSTIDRRSSGSITVLRASVTCSCVGILGFRFERTGAPTLAGGPKVAVETGSRLSSVFAEENDEGRDCLPRTTNQKFVG